jgi:hypothetical protein
MRHDALMPQYGSLVKKPEVTWCGTRSQAGNALPRQRDNLQK